MAIAESHPTVSDRLPAPLAIAAVALAIGVALVQGSAAGSVLRGVLVLVLIPCAVIDLRRRIIPNRITGPAAISAVVLGLALDAGHEPSRLLWAALAGGFLLFAALVNPAGMGMGDVKLIAVMGLFLGSPVVVALLFALLGNVATAAVLTALRGWTVARKTKLAFGPYLAAGGLLASVFGNALLHAYLSAH